MDLQRKTTGRSIMRTARATGGRIPWIIPSTDWGISHTQASHEYLQSAETLATIPTNETAICVSDDAIEEEKETHPE